MKKAFIFLGLSLALFSLASCNNEQVAIKYETKNVAIYRNKDKADKTIPIRFYSKYPNVPYVGIKEYFKEFYKKDLSVTKRNDFNVFKIDNNEYIKIDSKESILGIKDIYNLGHHPDFRENKNKTIIISNEEKRTEPKYKIIDLSKYDILTYNTDTDSYVPVGLLNNIYGTAEWYNVAYNGQDIYVFDFSGDLNTDPNEPAHNEEYFSQTYYNYYNNLKERHADLAKYTYNQLCFSFDNIRGYTSQLVFGDNNLVSLGLDTLLEKYYPGIKRLLLSTKKEDYEKGFLALIFGMFDGGHTGPISKNPPTLSYIYDLQKEEEFKALGDRMVKVDSIKSNYRSVLFNSRSISLGQDIGDRSFYYRYNSEYKTAYIGFDRFIMNKDLWNAYYNGDKTKLEDLEKEYDIQDTYAFVRKSLFKAKEDGASNVVLDLSINGGGEDIALAAVIGLFNGAKAKVVKNNIVDSSREEKTYNIDINLDGKFDDSDINLAKSFNFNVSVLTSKLSFSCGNLFPSLMKEMGYKIIGEQSGGGSCNSSREETADGFIYNKSGYLCICNLAGDNIDSGVAVDYSLVNVVNGVKDYSKFYDAKTISDYLASIKK